MKKGTLFLTLILGMSLTATASTTRAEAVVSTTIASYDASSLTKTDGSFWIWGSLQSVPTQIPDLNGVTATFDNGLVQKQDKSVWLFQSQFPNPTMTVTPVSGISNIVDVFNYGRTLAVDADGKIFSSIKAADNWDLTHFEAIPEISNVVNIEGYYEYNDMHGTSHFLFLKKDGTVWESSDSLDSFASVPSLSNVTQLQSNIALKKDGTVWTWPNHSSGTNPLPSIFSAAPIKSLNNITSIKSTRDSYLAIDSQSRLWFWGGTVTGYSDGTTYTYHADPILLSGVKNVKDAYVVEHSLVVLTGDNKVYETTIARESMPANASFKLIATDVSTMKNGVRHIIMQKKDGSIWGWGVNKNAQLGNGEYEFMQNTAVPVQKPISISLNGENVSLTQGVITRNGQNFVPLRSVFEKLGAEITFSEATKLATVTRKDASKPLAINVNVKTGQTSLNNTPVTLENNPFTVNGTVYLPLRFISEKLGANVEWLPQEERIAITIK